MLLIRDGDPWELLLVHRPGGADFAPGAYVFPGGAIHEDDQRWEDSIRAAAVRELFEEAGILLARSFRGGFAGEAHADSVRSLIQGGASFTDALGELGLAPAMGGLVLVARWVTPAQMRRRFDARFFLARLPDGQSVRPQEGEVTDWLWIAPRKALENPEITLVYATRAVLESVADTRDVSALFARARKRRKVPLVEPRLVQTEAGWEIVRD